MEYKLSYTGSKIDDLLRKIDTMEPSQGDPGVGVPVGGFSGQVLVKASDENYDTKWAEIEVPEAPVASGIDYSNLGSGQFSVMMNDGTTKAGTVVFDGNGNPTSITLDGRTLTITFPA